MFQRKWPGYNRIINWASTLDGDGCREGDFPAVGKSPERPAKWPGRRY